LAAASAALVSTGAVSPWQSTLPALINSKKPFLGGKELKTHTS
jgi:hypothetical protein